MKRSKLLKHLNGRLTQADIDFLREDPARSYLLAKHKVGKLTIRLALLADGSMLASLNNDSGSSLETHRFQIFEIRYKENCRPVA